MSANFLNEDQADWLETVNKFMDNEVTVEYVRNCDVNREYPYEAYEKIARQGCLGKVTFCFMSLALSRQVPHSTVSGGRFPRPRH